MIKLLEVQKSICERIRKGFGENQIIVFSKLGKSRTEDIDKIQRKSFFYVHMNIHQTNTSPSWVDKRINLDITYVVSSEDIKTFNMNDLYNKMDLLQDLFSTALPIRNRFITIADTNTYFANELLHLSFNLVFSNE